MCGSTALFWKDLWLQETIELSHPRAFSFTLNEDASVKEFLEITSLAEAFHLPLSPQAHAEVRDLQAVTTHLRPVSATSDVWHYVWGKAHYNSADYYRFFFRDVQAHQVFSWLWKSKCVMKMKVFGWLLLNDRLNTRNMLLRRHYNIGDDHDCLLCGLPIEETVDHMIFTCTFSRQCWSKLNIDWPMISCRLQLIQTVKDTWHGPLFFKKFLVAAWSLWKERNNKHFRAVDPTVRSWIRRFKEDFELLQHRVKEAHRPLVTSFVAFLH